MEYQTGMLVESRAGHDKGELYIITGITDGYALLSDGRLKPVDHPKRKKPMHIAKKADIPALLAEKLTQGMPLTNEDIKRVIIPWSLPQQ